MKPPYGRITAINLNRGEQVVDGAERRRSAQSSRAQGAQSRSARWRCAFIGHRDEDAAVRHRSAIRSRRARLPDAGGKKFKALDKATGKTLWEIELEAGANGTPMTYLFNGKQYVVFAIGGQNHSAELVALALP